MFTEAEEQYFPSSFDDCSFTPFEEMQSVWNPVVFDDFSTPIVTVDGDFPYALLDEEIAYYGSPPLQNNELVKPFHILGFEVGDDRVDFFPKPRVLRLMTITQASVFGMKTSKEDTFISSTCFNLCEVTTMIPRSILGGFHACRGSGSFENIEFNDVIPLRIVIDVSKQSGDHSSSVVGKASQIGTKVSCPRRSDGIESVLHICSLFQDGMLKTVRSQEPKYLHKALGGGGCRALFNNISNIFTYMRTYRGGCYHRLYATAVAQAQAGLDALENGRAVNTSLIGTLRMKQEYLYGTYGDLVAIPHRGVSRETGVLPPPLYHGEELDGLMRCVEHRLIRTRQLIRKREAEVEYEKYEKLEVMLKQAAKAELCIERTRNAKALASERFNGALSANTAFQALLSRKANGDEIPRLFKDGWEIIMNGQLEFLYSHAQNAYHAKLLNGNYTYDDLQAVQDVFLQSEVSVESTLKVEGIPLDTIIYGRKVVQDTSSRLGLYRITQSEAEWASETVQALVAAREVTKQPLTNDVLKGIYFKSTEWVQDDEPIMLAAKEYVCNFKGSRPKPMLIVTMDKKLCARIAEHFNIVVYLLPTDMFLQRYLADTHCKVIEEDTLKSFTLMKVCMMMADEIHDIYRWEHPHCIEYDMGSIREEAKQLSPTNGNDRLVRLIKPLSCEFDRYYHRHERTVSIPMKKSRYSRMSFYLPVSTTDTAMRNWTKAEKPKYLTFGNNLSKGERQFLDKRRASQKMLDAKSDKLTDQIRRSNNTMARAGRRVANSMKKARPKKDTGWCNTTVSFVTSLNCFKQPDGSQSTESQVDDL